MTERFILTPDLNCIKENPKSKYLDFSKVKVIGSSNYVEFPNDLDLITYDNETLNTLIALKVDIEKIHPIFVSEKLFNNFEEYISFYNVAVTRDLNGTLYKSKNFIDDRELKYNINSYKFFNNLDKIKKFRDKLISIGFEREVIVNWE